MKYLINKAISSGLTKIILILPLLYFFLLSSCNSSLDLENISHQPADSLALFSDYPFSLNANFEVIADSLSLEQLPVEGDFKHVYKGNKIVVGEFGTIPADTIDSLWVKVAHNQDVQGWIRQSELKENIVPLDYISRFIYWFSNTETKYLLIIISVLFLSLSYLVISRKKMRDRYSDNIDRTYPLLLCLTISFSAVMYSTIRVFYPDMWEWFYFNPTLNPFRLPLFLAVLIITVWLNLILFLAVIDDTFRRLSFGFSVLFLIGLTSVCILLHLFFSFFTPYLIGYAFFVLLLFLFIWKSIKNQSYRYYCGHCGKEIKDKGRCPYCGAINE